MTNLTRTRENTMTTKTYKIENITEKTTLITVEVQGKQSLDCAGWYVRNGQIIGKRWDDQPNYKLPASKLKEAVKINLFNKKAA